MADSDWERDLWNDFEGDKKIFWKEVKRVRKSELARDEMEKDVNGQILRDSVQVRRGAEYFKQVLNEADVRGGKYQCSCQFTDAVLGYLNEIAISLE